MYTPLRTDEPDVSSAGVFYGGLNVYLQGVLGLFRRTPRIVDWVLDRPGLLKRLERFAGASAGPVAGELTVSILSGRFGPQRKDCAGC